MKSSCSKQRIPREILNAREWNPDLREMLDQSSASSSEPESEAQKYNPANVAVVSQAQQRPEVPVLTVRKVKPKMRVYNFPRDNAAKAAFRERLPAAEVFELYKDPSEIQPDRVKLYEMLEEMGVRFRSFIRPPQHAKDKDVLIWGDRQAASKTVAALKEWLKRSEGPADAEETGRSKFSKELSTSTKTYKDKLQKSATETVAKFYQQVPADGQKFPFTGVFLWPMEEVNPYEVFGNSVEAFDPIRINYKCHITFDDRLSAFRVFADTLDSVHRAQDRIAIALESIKMQSSRSRVEYLVLPAPMNMVHLLAGVADAEGKITCMIPRMVGAYMVVEDEQLQESILANRQQFESALLQVVPSLPFYQGQLHLSVVFGSFELQAFRRPRNDENLSFDDFASQMKQPRTRGTLNRNVGFGNDHIAITTMINSAGSLLMPIEHNVAILSEVIPLISGRFVIHRYERSSIQLNVEWQHTPVTDQYERTNVAWSRYDSRSDQTPISIYFVQLDGGCSSHFKVANEHSLDKSKIEPRMASFADSVKLKRKSSIAGPSEHGFTYGSGYKPSALERKVAFRYRLVPNPAWILEIARYDIYEPHSDLPVSTYWGSSMWNTAWDFTMAGNSSLAVGRRAPWEGNIRTFFPNEGDVEGFEDLMSQVSNLLNAIKSL